MKCVFCGGDISEGAERATAPIVTDTGGRCCVRCRWKYVLPAKCGIISNRETPNGGRIINNKYFPR